jgi:hypothetical protein
MIACWLSCWRCFCFSGSGLPCLPIFAMRAGFYALVVLLRSIDLAALAGPALERLPRRGPAAFFLVAGLMTAVVWLLPLVTALLNGEPPSRMDTYTTEVTFALDLALILPACLITARLLLRRAPLGYVVAVALLGIIVLLGPNFVAQTISQLRAGVEFTGGEAVGPIAGFGTVAAFGVWVLVAILRRIPGRRAAIAVAAPSVAVPSGAAADAAREAQPA